MQLKIWEDEQGKRHTSLDSMDISSILRGLVLADSAGRPCHAALELVPSSIKAEINAEVELVVNNNKYRLKSIKKESQ